METDVNIVYNIDAILVPIVANSRDLSRHTEYTAHGPGRMWAYGALPSLPGCTHTQNHFWD